ncbi:MAG: hypothetical protein NVV68_15305 [Dokdonella sp.]|nr:hypothetical protein [Dokdonella sp.]
MAPYQRRFGVARHAEDAVGVRVVGEQDLLDEEARRRTQLAGFRAVCGAVRAGGHREQIAQAVRQRPRLQGRTQAGGAQQRERQVQRVARRLHSRLRRGAAP